MARFTWKKEIYNAWWPEASLVWELNYGPHKNLACVSTVTKGFSHKVLGWMWSCREDKELGIEYRNTVAEGRAPHVTPEEAKADALAYVRECLTRAGAIKGGRG